MKLKYVGLKPQCTAFKLETGITWLPGAVHDVKDALATKMLKHPDVFAVAAKAAAPEQEAEQGEAIDAGDPITELTPLESMSKEQLQQLAKAKGLTVHHKAGVESLIKAIKAA